MIFDGVKEWASFIAAIVAGAAAAIGSAFVTVRWILHKEFASQASVAMVAEAIKDIEGDLQKQIDQSRHDHAMLAKDVSNLPSYRQIDELKDSVGELKQGQAVSREKLDGVKDDIAQLRLSFDRLGEDLRRNK